MGLPGRRADGSRRDRDYHIAPHLIAERCPARLVARDIWATIAAIRAEDIATIVVDRDLAALSAIADRVMILATGLTVFAGTPAELAAQPELKHRHLGI